MLSICPSATLLDCDHTHRGSWKVISRINRAIFPLLGDPEVNHGSFLCILRCLLYPICTYSVVCVLASISQVTGCATTAPCIVSDGAFKLTHIPTPSPQSTCQVSLQSVYYSVSPAWSKATNLRISKRNADTLPCVQPSGYRPYDTIR